jgi:hypothetical protein
MSRDRRVPRPQWKIKSNPSHRSLDYRQSEKRRGSPSRSSLDYRKKQGVRRARSVERAPRHRRRERAESSRKSLQKSASSKRAQIVPSSSQDNYRSDIHSAFQSVRGGRGCTDGKCFVYTDQKKNQAKNQVKKTKKVQPKTVRPEEMKDVVILGHSFIRNLHSLVTSRQESRKPASFPMSISFNLQEVVAHWVYDGGLKVADINVEYFVQIAKANPRIVYMQLADNDLGGKDLPKSVARATIDLAKGLANSEMKICIVIISKALPGEAKTRHLEVSVERYNQKVEAFNTYLDTELMHPGAAKSRKVNPESCVDPRVWVWDHRRFGPRINLHQDGVHLNEAGLRALYYSIRSAIQIGLLPQWDK